jgi:2'-hydroxyisoflavone reductase
VIGGTRFAGRFAVRQAVADGWDVTILHRGTSAFEGADGVHEILGDRKKGLHGAEARSWDAVLDFCGYTRSDMRAVLPAIRNCTRRYVFISSVSVYADLNHPGADEDHETLSLEDPDTEDVLPNYGGLKRLCELEALDALAERATIIRPGLIGGPYDPTPRFPYWPWRVAKGGPYLAGGLPEQPVQLIDPRDLAGFILRLAAEDIAGVFNATGAEMTLRDFQNACRAVNPSAEPVWASYKELEAAEIHPWADLPLVLPQDSFPFAQISSERGRAVGLRTRPMEDTVIDTLAWLRGLPEPPSFALSEDREAPFLKR